MTALRVTVAWSLWSRVRGLLGRPCPPRGHGLLIPRCHAVHTLGMRYPIDVVFLDARMRVVAVHERVGAGRWRLPRCRAMHTLELRSGGAAAAGLRPGVTPLLLLWPASPGKG